MSTRLLIFLFTALAASAPTAAHAQYYTEEFDLSFPPPDWISANYSAFPQTGWFRGNPAVFSAQAGASNGYAAANFLATQEHVGISLWFFSAPLDFQAGDILTFYTRSENVPGTPFGDGLVVRMGIASSFVPASYQTVLLELGPVLAGPYPTQWTRHVVAIPQNSHVSGSRLAFEYFAEDPDAASYIGLDSVGIYAAGSDSDGDLVPDPIDNCPTVPNLDQGDGGSGLETPPDSVGDACDNCLRASNPRVAANFLALNPWGTLTGGQRDDDHDGYGNKCDAKFVGTPAQSVGALDLAQYRSSNAGDRRLDTCGTTDTRPCAIFDLDEAAAGNFIGALDLGRLRALSGSTPGPRCAACTGTGSALLPCTAGTAGSCVAP